MQHFRRRGGSSLWATSRQKADGHMLRKQDPRRSSNQLYDYGERASGGGDVGYFRNDNVYEDDDVVREM